MLEVHRSDWNAWSTYKGSKECKKLNEPKKKGKEYVYYKQEIKNVL